MGRVVLRRVCKRFQAGVRGGEGLLSRVTSLISGREEKRIVCAVKDVSLEAVSGRNVGVIGRNASGKSTLLKIVAGILRPDGGEVRTEGRIAYLNGFGRGIRPKLTMRENARLVGALMGLTRKEVDRRLPEMVAFAGLERYVDTKAYQLSSGMGNRLNFSITIHCVAHQNPDILLLDEAIGAGSDITFQEKALEKMEELIRGGATVLLVSHNMEQVKRYCDEAVWIDEGSVAMRGTAGEVAEAYLEEHSRQRRERKMLKERMLTRRSGPGARTPPVEKVP